MARFLQIGTALVCFLAAACNTPPPRPWLRFQPSGPTNWTVDAAGVLQSRLHGTEVSVDLGRTQTRVLVTVTAQMGSGDRTLAEYTLEHAGALDRLAAEH